MKLEFLMEYNAKLRPGAEPVGKGPLGTRFVRAVPRSFAATRRVAATIRGPARHAVRGPLLHDGTPIRDGRRALRMAQ